MGKAPGTRPSLLLVYVTYCLILGADGVLCRALKKILRLYLNIVTDAVSLCLTSGRFDKNFMYTRLNCNSVELSVNVLIIKFCFLR